MSHTEYFWYGFMTSFLLFVFCGMILTLVVRHYEVKAWKEGKENKDENI